MPFPCGAKLKKLNYEYLIKIYMDLVAYMNVIAAFNIWDMSLSSQMRVNLYPAGYKKSALELAKYLLNNYFDDIH